jgi:hypothetical protein
MTSGYILIHIRFNWNVELEIGSQIVSTPIYMLFRILQSAYPDKLRLSDHSTSRQILSRDGPLIEYILES